jgi:hypothetical protein
VDFFGGRPGVGGRKERKKKAKEKRKRPTQRSGMGLKALRRGLGVGGRKREMVGITLKGKRVGSRGKKVKVKKKSKSDRGKIEE